MKKARGSGAASTLRQRILCWRRGGGPRQTTDAREPARPRPSSDQSQSAPGRSGRTVIGHHYRAEARRQRRPSRPSPLLDFRALAPGRGRHCRAEVHNPPTSAPRQLARRLPGRCRSRYRARWTALTTRPDGPPGGASWSPPTPNAASRSPPTAFCASAPLQALHDPKLQHPPHTTTIRRAVPQALVMMCYSA